MICRPDSSFTFHFTRYPRSNRITNLTKEWKHFLKGFRRPKITVSLALDSRRQRREYFQVATVCGVDDYTTAVRNYPKERSLNVEEEEKTDQRLVERQVREIPRIFSSLPCFPLHSVSFSFSFSFCYPSGSSYAPWEIGLNGVVQNRFSKISTFRRIAISDDRDKSLLRD